MEQFLDNYKPDFEKSLAVLSDTLTTLRVGRANSIMVENIMVDAYGSQTPIKQMASITVPEARTILITPWDKTVIKDIEKAIKLANIGINPVNEGAQLRLTVPALTEESRKELVKSVGEKMDKTKITMKQIRDKAKDNIVKQEKAKQITEDDKYDLQKKLDEMVKSYNEKIKSMGNKKESEIMTL